MKEMQSLVKEYEELTKRLENIEEIGVLDLSKIAQDLDSLRSRAGITATSFANNPENDLGDKKKVLDMWNEIFDTNYELTFKTNMQHDARWKLTQSRFEEYRKISEYKRENQKTINEYKFELDKHKALLNHMTDTFAKDNMEDTIKDDAKRIKKAEELNKKYDKEMSLIMGDIDILLHGGKIKISEKLDEEDIEEELDRFKKESDIIVEEDQEEAKEAEVKEAKKEEPAIKKLAEVSEEREDDESLDNPLKAIVMPPLKEYNTKDLNVNPEKKEIKEEDLVLSPKFDDEKEDEENPIKRDADGNLVLPSGFDEGNEEEDNKEEDNEEEKEVDEDRDSDLDEPIEAEIIKPKDSLWRKMGIIIQKAMAFLGVVGILGTAHHTGMMLKNQKVNPTTNKDETVERTETEKTDEKKEETKDTSKHEEPKKETPKEENKSTPVADTTPKKEEPKKEEKPVEPVKEEPKEEKLNIELKPGETAYNTETGVEVGYSGKAAATDGTPQKDRTLEHTEDGKAIVNENDLNKDTTTKTVNQTERTDQEVTKEEFFADKSEEEKAAANKAEDDWFNYMMENNLIQPDNERSR